MIDSVDEKNAHPIAAQIPYGLWVFTFGNKLNENDIRLFNKSFGEVKKEDLPPSASQAFIILLISYPNTSASELLDFAQKDYLVLLKSTPKIVRIYLY